MNVVDSSGWLEYMAGARNAGFFAPAIEDTARLVVPAVSLYEVFRRVLVQRGLEDALQAATFMHRGRVVPLTPGLAVSAARLGVELSLPMADSMMLATAREEGAILWSQDADFKGIEGVRYTPARLS